MRHGLAIFATLVVVVATAMCGRDLLQRPDAAPSHARPLGVYTPARPGTSRGEAHAALERDARRREARFVDATRPGSAFAGTRVTSHELAAMTAAHVFEIGAQLFHHRFTPAEGYGAADLPHFGRIQRGARGGPDAYRCASCHRRGGIAGAGDASDNAYLDGDGDAIDSALTRNPIALPGAGLVELIAAEMSADLATLRARALGDARRGGQAVRVALMTKGVSFGHLSAGADGKLDVSEVDGVDRDLVIKPFGWKGHAATLREVVEDELALHHGMQTSALAASGARARIGPSPAPDPDGDGVVDEVTEGQLGALTLFVAMQEVPEIGMPTSAQQVTDWAAGQQAFAAIGCAACHVPALALRSTVFSFAPRDGGPSTRIDLATHGAEPRVGEAGADGSYRVYLFSDLKRHVVGPHLREARAYRGVSQAAFLTRPLWGVARSRPYMHDARAPTLEEAILAHSGEATAARDAYAALDDQARAPIRIYLTSLTRAPRLASP